MIKNIYYVMLCASICLLCTCQTKTVRKPKEVFSPNQLLKVSFSLTDEGQAYYLVSYNNQPILDTSLMGFEFRDAAPLADGLQLISTSTATLDENWEMPLGEQKTVRNNYNELKIALAEKWESEESLMLSSGSMTMDLALGMSFRSNLPGQKR